MLPTLTTILKKTKAEVPNLFSATSGIAYGIECFIKRRFSYIFGAKDAIIAALTLLKFKVKWVDSQEKKDSYEQTLMEELYTLERDIAIEENSRSDESATQQEKKTDFYEFDTNDDKPEEDDLESEVAEYFKNAKSLECLDKYPKIRRLFLRYNVTIPSSTPVERLLSLGSLGLSSKRNRLTDQKFERLLLMRYNKHFTEKLI